MEINDALVITGLGIGVVFSGLILTNLMIASFSFFPRLIDRVKAGRSEKRERNIRLKNDQSGELDPDIIAVITTVLEVESRLRQALAEKF